MQARLECGFVRRRELGQFAIEPGVLDAGGSSEKMPFHRFDHVLWQSAPGRQKARDAVLCDGVVAHRRLEKELRRRRFVLADAYSIEKHDCIFNLRRNIIVLRGAANPKRCLLIAFFDAGAISVKQAQGIGGIGIAELRGLSKEPRGPWKIRGHAIIFDRENPEVVERAWMILRGRLFEQLRRSGAIFRYALTFEFGDPQCENRLAIPGVGSELVPAGGFRKVAPDAQPQRKKLAGK